MTFSTIIPVSELSKHLEEPDWAIVDCRFKLADPKQGRREYETMHIPGAVFADLKEDLSGPVIQGVTGRHPLPDVDQLRSVFSRLGIGQGVQVVAYDDLSGAMAAGRLWWLLRWLGHTAVAVLDGGWQSWVKAGLPTRAGIEGRDARKFIPRPRNELILTAEEVERIRRDARYRLLDARTSERFRGENETIDLIPGHIPGAVSMPYPGNLNPDGTFLSAASLHSRYKRVLGNVPIDQVGVYCGSGVTATVDILAMMLAGMGEARLYAGSYSDWITDPQRPVEK